MAKKKTDITTEEKIEKEEELTEEEIEAIEDEVAETREFSKETIDKLLEFIKKEKKIAEVSSALGLNDFEVLGLVHDLKDSGLNIIVKQYDDGFHLLNQGDVIDQDVSTYSFESDDANCS